MVTKNISNYIKDKGISLTRIANVTGISYQVLCNCFNSDNSRELRADELLKVCRFLDVNPYDFMEN